MMAIVAVLAYIMISIANFASFDGWIRVGELFSLDQPFPGIVGLIESCLLTVNFLVLIYLIYIVHTWDSYSSKSETTSNKE